MASSTANYTLLILLFITAQQFVPCAEHCAKGISPPVVSFQVGCSVGRLAHGYSSWVARPQSWRHCHPSKYHELFTQQGNGKSQNTRIFNPRRSSFMTSCQRFLTDAPSPWDSVDCILAVCLQGVQNLHRALRKSRNSDNKFIPCSLTPCSKNSCLSLRFRLRHFSTTMNTKCGRKCEGINHEEARIWQQEFVACFETKCTYVLYHVPEHGSCHGMYWHIQALYAIKPPCSDMPLKKHPVLFRQQKQRKTIINL